MKRRTLDEILGARAEKRPMALLTDLESGLQGIVMADEYFRRSGSGAGGPPGRPQRGREIYGARRNFRSAAADRS